ncbi:MAG: MFS transporter [Rhodocyclaceae bacterium]|nr:MAG: MFS transporter [Rhodocyclaceae bacterium]
MTAIAADPTARTDYSTISLVGLAHGTSHFFHLMLPPLFPWLMPEFSLSFTQAGVLMSVFFLISGIGQALSGFLVDRIGPLRVLFWGMALLGLSGIMLGMAQNYLMLFAAASLAGLGNSVFHPVDFTILNRRVTPIRLGHAFSAHGLSGNLGWAAAPLSMAGIAGTAGWHAAGFAAGAWGFAVLLILYWRRESIAVDKLPAKPGHLAEDPVDLAFLKVRAVWICFAFFLLTTMALGVLQNFSPTILNRLYPLSLAAATSALTVYMVGSACGILLGGFLAGRGESQLRVIVIALTSAAVVAGLLASAVPPAWSVLALMAGMGFSVGVVAPSRDLLIRKASLTATGAQGYGRIYGFVYSGGDVGFVFAPLVFGPIMDAGQIANAMIGVALLQTLAIFTALNMPGQNPSSARR